jgi:hypothetical protein
MKQHFVTAALIFFASTQLWAQKIQFNPDAPLYIEYKTSTPTKDSDVSVQIDDATGTAKIRLSLQAKPEAQATYYGYIWLQIGKKISKEVIFKRGKVLSGWLTNQDDIQALFLFDSEKEMTDFKNKAEQSKKPLTDKAALPQLQAAAKAPPPPPTSKAIEFGAEMGEVAKYAKLMEAYAAFSPEQKKVNDEKAAQIAASALKSYQAKKYPLAEAQFEESLRLNPTVLINRYYLAISYYQNKKYDKSLALLSLAEGADYSYAEYHYYNGMSNLKLKNYTKASESFDMSKEENDPEYSGVSAFYNGHIFFQKEDFVQSRQNFEYTIDYSKNPKIDSEAEAMLEKIDEIEGANAAASKDKFRYTLFVGFGYDSNVLNVSTENRATDLAAYRLLYGGDFTYRFLNSKTQDMSVGLNASDYYSLSSKFKSDATVQSADPLNYGGTLTYHRNFQIGKRIFTWGLMPSYQVLNMAYETTSRENLLNMTIIGSDLTFAISEKHFSKFFIEYAMDKMKPAPALAEDNLTANRLTFATSQILVTGAKVKESWTGDLNYTINAADGDNNDYNKAGLGLTYARMGFWNAINTVRLDYANAKYPNAVIDRTDSVASLTLGLVKELTSNLNLFVNGLYTISNSTNDSYKYNKFGIQSMLTYSGAF